MSAVANAAPAPGDVYAVIVGYNGGRPGLPGLHFADDDAIRFSLFMRGLDSPTRRVHVWTLTEIDAETADMLDGAGLKVPGHGPPTRSALAAVMADVGRALTGAHPGAPPPSFYFIYAGHGLPGQVLLQPEPGSSQSGITGHEISVAVSALTRSTPDLRAFVFLDACRSQSLFSPRGSDPEIGPDLVPQARSLERAASAVRIGILTAAFSGKLAGEVPGVDAGSFSHFLASGMRGAADADGDQIITFGELVGFVTLKTAGQTGQRPWFMPPAGDFSEPAIDLRGYSTRLDLSGMPPGEYRVQGIGGRPVFAQSSKSPGQRLSLVLPPGRYQLVRVSKGGRVEARSELTLAAGQVTDATAVPLVSRGDGASVARGNDAFDESSSGDDPPPFPAPAPDDEPSPSNAFGPDVVDAVIAAYQAGREPAQLEEEDSNSLSLAASVARAPLGVGGAEPGIAVAYRRHFGRFLAGLGLSAGRSSHMAGESYRLDRYAALLEAGPVWSRGSRFEARLSLNGGAVSVVRRAAASPTRGDLAAPTLGAALGLCVRVAGALSLEMSGRYLVEWINLDGTRNARGNPNTEMGINYAF